MPAISTDVKTQGRSGRACQRGLFQLSHQCRTANSGFGSLNWNHINMNIDMPSKNIAILTIPCNFGN
jgi:hypothetical protein